MACPLKISRLLMWLTWLSSISETYLNPSSPANCAKASCTSTNVSKHKLKPSKTFNSIYCSYIKSNKLLNLIVLKQSEASASKLLFCIYDFPTDFPKDQQFAGVQAAIYLLPDENREALQSLLLFLQEVVACVEENQMTPTNIAVCLAPSLFHLNSFKRDRTSMR